MSERVEKAVARFQKWGQQNLRWIALSMVAIQIPNLALSSNHEPVSYWLSWFIIVSGLIVVIQWPSHLRKIEKAQAEREQAKSSGPL
jgi:hypothetical protein